MYSCIIQCFLWKNKSCNLCSSPTNNQLEICSPVSVLLISKKLEQQETDIQICYTFPGFFFLVQVSTKTLPVLRCTSNPRGVGNQFCCAQLVKLACFEVWSIHQNDSLLHSTQWNARLSDCREMSQKMAIIWPYERDGLMCTINDA